MRNSCYVIIIAAFTLVENACSLLVGRTPSAPGVYLVPLRRESVPVRRHGKVASFKTSYSGIVRMGTPAQEFRAVFDTGSGHIVLPAAECQSEACKLHRRYNMTSSSTAVPINIDGSEVAPGAMCDQVTIGFGTGEIKGEFVKDRFCLGPPSNGSAVGASANEGDSDMQPDPCTEASAVAAVQMSTQPFKTFQFDGILGLGLSSLAVAPQFSFVHLLSTSMQLGSNHFGIFLTDGEEGEESEIAIGGHNSDRLLEPLTWSPVAQVEMGYWQVQIKAIRVDGVTLDFCEDGTCRGVVDSGTSHLGVPAPFDKQVSELLTQDAGDLLDCRLADAPTVEIELQSMNLTLYSDTYMRRLPLREGVSVGSLSGVTMNSSASGGASNSGSSQALAEVNDADAKRYCRPRLMPVNLPAPLGPKLFILGEPVLHRYYTVFDWAQPQVAFGLARNAINTRDRSQIASSKGELPDEMEVLLMQQSSTVKLANQELLDEAVFVQVRLTVMRRV